jgi:hypothetical protein
MPQQREDFAGDFDGESDALRPANAVSLEKLLKVSETQRVRTCVVVFRAMQRKIRDHRIVYLILLRSPLHNYQE